jgi:hypothetical protein
VQVAACASERLDGKGLIELRALYLCCEVNAEFAFHTLARMGVTKVGSQLRVLHELRHLMDSENS